MGYVEDRADLRYYKYLRSILAMVAGKAESIVTIQVRQFGASSIVW